MKGIHIDIIITGGKLRSNGLLYEYDTSSNARDSDPEGRRGRD